MHAEWRSEPPWVTHEPGRPRPFHAAPGTRANEVFPTVDSRIGWMTDQEVNFTITAAADPFSMYSMVMDTLADQLESVLNSNLRTEGWVRRGS